MSANFINPTPSFPSCQLILSTLHVAYLAVSNSTYTNQAYVRDFVFEEIHGIKVELFRLYCSVFDQRVKTNHVLYIAKFLR